MYLFSELNFFPLIILLALWSLGGYLMVTRIFDLDSAERPWIGLGVGLTIATLLANVLARFLPTSIAFWLSALLTLGLGLALAWPLKLRETFTRENLQLGRWLLFVVAVFVFTLIGRGLGIFDDYQNLPQIPSMALGDIPPHFAFDPNLIWSYHYFLLLVAAQFERLTGAAPWVALDLARGLTLALTLSLGGVLAYRLTRSQIAATLSVSLLFFAGGARWILLLLPARLLEMASSGIQMIGSGADTGPNLNTALYKYWDIQGLGPLPFPFAYGSGLDASLVMAHAGYGTSMVMLVLLAVLLATRISGGWKSQAVLAVLLAALSLANEVTFVFLYAGLIFALLVWVIKQRRLTLPKSLLQVLPAMIGGGLLAMVQGGVFTGILVGWLGRLTGTQTEALYKVSFAMRMPTVLSAHVGNLSLLNPVDWFVILAETGLVILALPWVIKYGLELARDEKWLEAAWIFSMVPSLLTVFVEYTGNAGPTALSRMTAHFLLVIKIYAAPLLWLWVRERSETIKITALAWGLAACLSGLSLFSLQLAAMPKPIYAEYLDHLDAKIYEKYWGTLPRDAQVFDPDPLRALTILGLHATSSNSYGPPSNPTFVALITNPTPHRINAAGYRYVYFDLPYWRKYASRFEDKCVVKLEQLEETGSDGKTSNLRWLLDVSACR